MQNIFSRLSTKQKKWIGIVSGIILLLFIGVFVYALSIRQSLLDRAMVRAKTMLQEEYGTRLEIGRQGFSGLTTVHLEKVSLTPDGAARLARIEDVRVSVKLFPLLWKRIQLDRVDLEEAFLTLVKEDSVANYDALLRRRQRDTTTPVVDGEVPARNLAQLADRLLNEAFDKIPSNSALKNVDISYQDSSGTQRIRIPEGQMRRGKFDIDVFLNGDDAKWNLSGKINRGHRELTVSLSTENPDLELPVLRRKFGLRSTIHKITFDLKKVKRHGADRLLIEGEVEVEGLLVNHHRLSDRDIRLPHAVIAGGILLSEHSLEVTTGSSVSVNDFRFEPQVAYVHAPSKQLRLAVHTGRFAAQDFFNALPEGLFETVEGVEVTGEIAFDLDFAVDFDQPDSLHFAAQMDDRNMTVQRWGKANIAALNQDFLHEVYEDTAKLRDIWVGETNANFTPLKEVAPILVTTVLNTEDPFFYEHKGFEEEAFQLSIVTNIKERAFKRGASTISMQLVKNLYLHRNKTVMRKLEEILLVWLMEQSGQVSKDRLLEIYFNIIEWGKNVYGIREASRYYFGKEPAQLTLGESLYLSSIIPRPKTGLASFDYRGQLKPWVQRHFNTYGYIMRRRDQLQNVAVPEGYGFYQVVLQPNLRPPRPRGIVDSIPSSDDMHEMIDDIDREERRRRSLIERLFGINKEESNDEG